MSNDVLYYSYKLRRSLADSSISVPPGAAHYSYSSVCSKFLNAFRTRQRFLHELERPEIHVDPPGSEGRQATHLIFKPYEEIRTLNNAKNFAHVAWEFEVLPTRADWRVGDLRRQNPFSDYVQMLKVPDRIWVGSSFAQTVFAKYGITNTDLVPAPITVPALTDVGYVQSRYIRTSIARRQVSRLQAVRLQREVLRNPEPIVLQANMLPLSAVIRENRTTFVHVANPGDLRKNLPSLLDGFALAAQRHPEIILILKITIDGVHTTMPGFIRDLLPRLYGNNEMELGDISLNNIFVISDYVPDADLNALFSCSDYYLTAAVAEGQNLPLQEAMAMGAIPVAADHTAMSDYIDADNAVLIDWTYAPPTEAFVTAYGLPHMRLPALGPEEVASAVGAAASLSPKQRVIKEQLARATIEESFSDEVIGGRVEELLGIAR